MKHRIDPWVAALAITLAALPPGPARADEPAAIETRAVPADTVPAEADLLARRLAAHQGQPLDLVELGNGRRLVRPILERVTLRDGHVVSLRLRGEGEPRAITVPLRAVERIVVERDTVHEAESGARSRGRRSREARHAQVAQSHARMRARGTEPWPPLTPAEHAAEVRALEAFVGEVRRAFPALGTRDTHEFLVATDLPAEQAEPFVATLDSLHDLLCDLYTIPRGEPVWKGKCLVFVFRNEIDYLAFERRFMQTDAAGTVGLCHQRSDGRVIMACHAGTDPATLAHALVHETSHGFNHRWLSPTRLPSWLNEGLAEWVGARLVPHSRQVPLKEARAIEAMRLQGNLGPDFFTRDHIDPQQYGIASSLVTFLARDPGAFAEFVQSIKEGMPVEESLRQAYGVSLQELVAAYGRTVGLPWLQP